MPRSLRSVLLAVLALGGLNGAGQTSPPDVGIVGVFMDGIAVSYETGVSLPKGRRNLEVRYAASSMAQFQFRLDGLEEGWASVGARTAAYYRHLPDGDYTFYVRASSDGIVWSAPAALSVSVSGAYYEKGWFWTLLVLGALGAVLAGYRWQAGRSRREAKRLEDLVTSRTRALSDEKARAENALTTVEEQALQLLRMDHIKNRLFTNVSHEIRTPLTLILHPLQQAAGREDLDDDLRRSLSTAHSNARRLLHLVNQILDLAKLDAGGAALRLVPLDVVAQVRQSVEAFASEAERLGVRLRFQPAQPTVPAHADRAGLDKVVFNLVSNALKATRAEGSVRVRVEMDGTDAYEIVVQDSGEGIAADEIDAVFDRFYQVETDRTRGGTGIGLALTREIVDLHGGTITVTSDPGTGSTFVVRLPVAPEVLEGGEGEELEPLEPLLSPPLDVLGPRSSEPDERPLVIVAEDHPELRALVSGVLRPQWRVAEAADGAEALALARAERPALVVSDVLMPGTDGLALCRSLRADPALADIPVILLTARVSEDIRLDALETGADDLLTKPFSDAELMARARNLVESRSALRRQYSSEVVVPTGRAVPSADAVFVERLYAAVDERLDDATFSVGEFARAVGMSESTLKRRVGRLAGVPPVEFVRGRRLERAAALLLGQAGTVSEIAAQVGFESPSYFARCFRERYGMTPSSFATHDGPSDGDGAAEPHVAPDPPAA